MLVILKCDLVLDLLLYIGTISMKKMTVTYIQLFNRLWTIAQCSRLGEYARYSLLGSWFHNPGH